MTQHNSPHAHKRIVMTYNLRTIVITSDKTLMTTAYPPARSRHSALAWKRAQRRDRRSRSMSQSAQLRLRLAPDWAQHAAAIAPTIGVATPTTDPRPPAADTWRAADQWAWWETISARTVALAVIATVLAAGAALVARGDVR